MCLVVEQSVFSIISYDVVIWVVILLIKNNIKPAI